MKGILLALCSILLVLSLTACGANSDKASQVAPSATQSEAPSEAPSGAPSETPSEAPSGAPSETPSETPSEAPSETPSEASEPTITPTPPINTSKSTTLEEDTVRSIQVSVGDRAFAATLDKNDAVNSFVELLQAAPVVLQMSDNSGFEKVGTLETKLPSSDRSMTAQAGDIVLYNGNQICVFYGSNRWSYTRLGRVDDLSGWEEALGSGNVELTFLIQS